MDPAAPVYQRACASSELTVGQCRLVTLGGREVQLFRVGSAVCALDNVCPHAGAPIDCALWDGETVTCTYHGLRFQVPGGHCPDAPGWELDSYPVKETAGFIWVALPPR